ncbi:MAG: MFS transporter, partial [Chloroflexales bacterium]|nr:MFS transporter [Chloroflexales bacterium]
GGVLLALNFALLVAAQNGLVPFGAGVAVRISLLSAGVWWGAFALVAFARLRTRPPGRILPRGQALLTSGFGEVIGTFRELRRLPNTLRYLVGYLFFNDGIQTVIGLSSVFLAQELFSPADRQNGTAAAFSLQIYLLVQFVAFGGALLFERIARLVGTKRAIMISLAIWAGIVIYAYGFLQTTGQALGMAVVLALVLGGSQALSRALFSRMIPRGREASFFGIYEVSERGTSWIGPLIFGIVVSATGSYRQAILSLIVLFVVGLIILSFTNTDKAIRDAGNSEK